MSLVPVYATPAGNLSFDDQIGCHLKSGLWWSADLFLIPAATGSAFAIYSGIIGQTVAEPGRQISLVGPRPHAVAMRTGDRGWAQVNGLRGEVDTLEKADARVAHGLYYIEHWSAALDLKILFKTARTLVSGDNAY
jgi:hypothetical protein